MFINADTKVIGLFGYPVKHTLSPFIHNAALQHMGLPYVYVPFAVKPHNLPDAVNAIRSLDFLGVNVTIPFKERVIEYLDDLSEEARACQAVNVIKNENGRLIGDNTDGRGFLESLKEENAVLMEKALIIGAGGAARAVAYTMAKSGFNSICFLDVDKAKSEELAAFIKEKTGIKTYAGIMSQNLFDREGSDADIIINCSPVGMYPDVKSSPVESLARLKPNAVICDIIYNPLETLFLKKARERGYKTVNGVGMFVYQGALTLEILTGLKPPVKLMEEVVYHHMGRREL